MRSSALRVLGLVTLLFLLPATIGHADTHGWRGGGGGWHGGGPRVIVGVGPSWGWGPGWGPSWWYGPGYYAYGPPIITPPAPPEYLEQPSAPPAGYWYYCASASDYYPHVATCPEPWVQVAPTPQ